MEIIDIEQFELQEVMKVRQWFYRFFVISLFEEPDQKQMIEYIQSNIFSIMLKQGESDLGISLLAASLEKMQQYNNNDWKIMREHYISLFANSGSILVCPWESVYSSDEHIIYDEHTLAVQDFYEKWGAEIIAPKKGPADHIGLECSFMAFMAGTAIQHMIQENKTALEENMLAQKTFLENHLLVFLEKFCDLLQKRTTMDFYQGLAQFLHAYIFADFKFLEQCLSKK